jgi:hypothetical protein
MNKTTIIALVTVVILGIVVFFVSREGEREELKTLALPGIKLAEPKGPADETKPEEAVSPEDAAKEAAKVGPVDRIAIASRKLNAVLKQTGDEQWTMVEPGPALADTYKVRAMLRTFDEALSSNYSRAVPVEALAKLGLDEENRIRVTLSKGDEPLIDLFLGRVDRKDDNGIDMDTMVMLPSDLESPVYYRIPGKDLRRSFDLKLSELRDKKVFSFGKDDIQEITIEDPRDGGSTLHLKKGSQGDDWQMVSPAGMEVENLSGFVSSLATTRADEFMETLPGADATALDKAYRITAVVKSGEGTETVTLELGAGRKKGVYARLAGKSGVFLVPKYTADQLMKSANDFRRKKIFTFAADEIAAITIADAGQPPISLSKSGADWRFVEPAGVAAASAKVTSVATGIANFRAAEFLTSVPEDTGLGEGATTITISLTAAAGGGSTTLRLGKGFKNAQDQERFYAQVEGQPEVFTVMRYSRDNLVKTVADLKDKRLFLVNQDDITKVTLTHPDQKLEFERTGDTWKMTAPKALATVELEQLVSTLASLDVEGTEPAKTPAEAGIGTDSFTISFALKNGQSHAVTISEEVTDNKNYATSSTNPEYANQLLLVSKYKVDNLTKKLPDFER